MIKIIKGYYGYKQGNSIIPKTVNDEPFSCDKAEEERLVKLGVAEYVTVETVVEANEEAPEALDKKALIARYKELGLTGNPASWKAETIAKKIAEAEAELEDEAPVFDDTDGVVE
jgi:hypothetical protein